MSRLPLSIGDGQGARRLVLVLVAVVVSRFVVLVAAVLAEAVLQRNPLLTSGAGGPLVTSLTSWDGWWYLGIARTGYHAQALVNGYHDYAFLPLWPALVRLASWPWPDYAGIVAVVLANVLFVVGLLLFVRLGEQVVAPDPSLGSDRGIAPDRRSGPGRWLGSDRAAAGAVILALSPFSMVFSMAYAESLFLCLSVGAFLAAERDRRAIAGVLVGLAAATRLDGAVLIVPVWLVLRLRDGRRPRPSQAWLLLGPTTAAGFLAAVGILAGGAGAYGAAQAAWGRSGMGAAAAGQSLAEQFSLVNAVQLATLLVAVFILVYARRDRLPLPYAVNVVMTLLLVFASGSLESVGRHVTLAFPNAWLLAGRRSRWFRLALPIVCTGLLGVASVAVFTGRFVP